MGRLRETLDMALMCGNGTDSTACLYGVERMRGEHYSPSHPVDSVEFVEAISSDVPNIVVQISYSRNQIVNQLH